MLFDKKITPSCSYCRHGSVIDSEHAICVKRGIVDIEKACRRFAYDPLKRLPHIRVKLSSKSYKSEDFKL